MPGTAWAWGSPMQGNPLAQGSPTHQVLKGTGMLHAGCLWARGCLMLGTFLGTGTPHRPSALWAQSSPALGTYRHGDPPGWAGTGIPQGGHFMGTGISPAGCFMGTGVP